MKNWLSLLLLGAGLIAGVVGAAATDNASLLEAQAKRFWAAEVQKDWGTVYDMSSPADRGTLSREQFAVFRDERGPYHYLKAKIDQNIVVGDFAWVHVQYEYKLPPYPDVPPRAGDEWHRWQKTSDGWQPVPRDELPMWPKLPPQMRPAADEAALAKRANEFWHAKATQDWKAVYAYLMPAFRANVPLEEFVKGRVRYFYLTPRIEWVEVEGQKGRAKVVFAAKPTDPAVSKMEPEERKAVDIWAKVDGQWYYDLRANKGF